MTAVLAAPAGGRARERGLLAGCLALAVLLALAATLPAVGNRTAAVPLVASGVAVDGAGRVVEVDPATPVVPGTRAVAHAPGALFVAAGQLAWLSSGRVPAADGVPPDLVRDALLDLHVLSADGGVPVAGWTPSWRYVWPRDAALAAAALARTGHPGDAERVIGFLQRVQRPDGRFEARYRVDGTVPDARPLQLDGVGWALWATREVALELPEQERSAFLQRHWSLVSAATSAARSAVAGRSALPPASSDYWELRERRLTLATAALIADGLAAAADLHALAGRPDPGAGRDARRVAAAVQERFGPEYPRRLGGRAGSTDLGVDFLLPPFGTAPEPAAVAAWRRSEARMRRPAGGLAPGGSWRDDGVSWTNVTATRALTAAYAGDREQATARLNWLAAHRTASGALPEKVLADGSPASVAPLAWTAAAVLLAADRLAVRPADG